MAKLLDSGTKRIKRLLAIILSLVLVTAAMFGSAYAATLVNSTQAENAATPKYYSAVKDWKLENNSADSGNVFKYQFAVDSDNPDWNYMAVKGWGYWYSDKYMCGIVRYRS